MKWLQWQCGLSLFVIVCGSLAVTCAAEPFLALARPWVADELKLSDEQRVRALKEVADFQHAMQQTAQSYPLGGQDSEGTQIRKRLERSIRETFEGTTKRLVGMLTEEQRESFRRLKLDAAADQTMKFETRRSFAWLLWPGDIAPLKLSEEQNTRLSAILQQATADWLTSEGGPDARLLTQRQRVIKDLRDVLKDEQLKLLPKDTAEQSPVTILIGQSQYDFFGSTDAQQAAMAKSRELQITPGHINLVPANNLKSMTRVAKEFGEPLEHIFWHNETQRILAAAISPNDRFVITLGSTVPGISAKGHELRLWDAKTGKLLAVTEVGHSGGESAGRSGSVRFLSSECVLFRVEPFGR